MMMKNFKQLKLKKYYALNMLKHGKYIIMGLAAELQCWASAAAGGDEVKCCQGSSLH